LGWRGNYLTLDFSDAETGAVGGAARGELDAGRPLGRAGLEVAGVAVAAGDAAAGVEDGGGGADGGGREEEGDELGELHFGKVGR